MTTGTADQKVSHDTVLKHIYMITYKHYTLGYIIKDEETRAMLKKLCDSEKDSENHKELSANLELREIVDIVKHFFLKYDTSRDGSIDESELSNLLSDLYQRLYSNRL